MRTHKRRKKRGHNSHRRCRGGIHFHCSRSSLLLPSLLSHLIAERERFDGLEPDWLKTIGIFATNLYAVADTFRGKGDVLSDGAGAAGTNDRG